MKKIIAFLVAVAVLFGIYEIYRNSDFYNNGFFAADSAVLVETENSRFDAAETFDEIKYKYKDVINDIKNGFDNLQDSIQLRSYRLTTEELAEVYMYIVLNCGYFYVDNNYSYFESGGYVISVSPVYKMKQQEIEGYKSQIDFIVDGIVKKVNTLNTNIEKLIYIHNYLVESIDYDTDDHDNENNIYGALLLKNTKCRGYSEAFQYITEKAGFKTYIVISDTLNHAWNMVNLSGKYYFVDCTWDDPVIDQTSLLDNPLSGLGSYKYFMCSQEYFLSNEHNADDWTVNGESIEGAAVHTEYDTFMWRDFESLMQYSNGSWYHNYCYNGDNITFPKDVKFSIDKITFTSNSQYDTKLVRTIQACWSVGVEFYVSFKTALQCIDEFIYYFTEDGIYRLEEKGRLNGKSDLMIFKNPTDKNIYDFAIDADSGTFSVVFGLNKENSKSNAVIETYNIADYFCETQNHQYSIDENRSADNETVYVCCACGQEMKEIA